MKPSKIVFSLLIAILSAAWLGVDYIDAGTLQGELVSLSVILSPALPGVFPLVAKKHARLHTKSQNLRRLA